MNQGTYPLAASMINQINRIDNISNNLANLNTNGFKQEGTTEGSFNYYLREAQKENKTPLKESVVMNTIPKMDSKYIIQNQGAVRTTGNSLDFSLTQADTFFSVQDANGNRMYTRDGAFKSLDGLLVDSNGNQVLNNDGEPIEIADGFENQIGVTQIPYSNLEKFKDNNYKVKNEADVLPLENNNNEIVQGTIEKSNVNSIKSMVGLIEAQRSFEQAQKAVNTIDEMNEKLIDKVGSVNS